VRWNFGPGEPVSVNPQQDVVQSNFDACSVFAQKHVKYVLADVSPPTGSCLNLIDTVRQGNSRMQVFEVVAP
jgi:hypothetical protein